MLRSCILIVLVFGYSQCLAGEQSYQLDFEVFAGESLLSTPSITVNAGQTGSITVGDEAGEVIRFEFVLKFIADGVVLLDAESSYRGESYESDLFVDVEREVSFVIGEYSFTVFATDPRDAEV